MSAVISPCEQYRYALTRPVGQHLVPPLRVVFVMLNPSTADASIDDPTIRRCRNFAERWGFDELTVVNLYARRCTDPKALFTADDPVGPNNDYWLRTAAVADGTTIVLAWGTHGRPDRVAEVRKIFNGRDVWCLGQNADGSPKHPLYLAGDTKLRLFHFKD